MKRAAVQWGIGRYLYDLESAWGNVEQNGKNSQKTKQGEWFKWSPPQLPAWALPKNKAPQQVNQQASGFNPDKVLARATNAMSACDMNTLAALWKQYSKELKPYPEQLGKLEEVKDIRKQELTPAA